MSQMLRATLSDDTERDNFGRCTTCQRVDCMCKDNVWLRTRLRQIIGHWNMAKESLIDYSNPAICIHCGGVVRKGHTEWFHFDGWFRDSRFCSHGGGKMAEPRADILSLAEKMATALDCLIAIAPINEGDGDDPELDAAYGNARTVLAEAKKTGLRMLLRKEGTPDVTNAEGDA